MEIEEMFEDEEHLDEEPLMTDEVLPESQMESEYRQALAVIASQGGGAAQKQLLGRRKILMLLAMHLQNFQQAILTSRRRSQQRMRRRQAMLRAFYVQQLMDLDTNFMELLPLPGGVTEMQATSVDDEREEIATGGRHKPSSVGNKMPTPTFVPMKRFYEETVAAYSPEQWLSTFRMSKRSFQWICDQLRDVLQPNNVNAPLKNLISLEKRVALSLYAFATGNDYRAIASLFDVSRTSVCKFIKRFAETVVDKLGDCLVAMPKSEQDYQDIRNSFQQFSNMPALVVGVLGHCELPVSTVPDNFSQFINASGSATIILEALVDDKMLFRKVQFETRRPTLYLEAPNDITRQQSQLINGRQLPSFVVTPAAYYPLRSWMLHQYEDPLEPHEYDFNEAVENLLTIQERAFRRLFARWRILQLKQDLEPRTMDPIAMACCALHNLLEENEELYLAEWSNGVDMSKLNVGGFKHSAKVVPDTEEAVEMRDFLARTISSTEM